MSKIVKKRLDYGRHLTPADIAQHLESMEVFATWVNSVLFGGGVLPKHHNIKTTKPNNANEEEDEHEEEEAEEEEEKEEDTTTIFLMPQSFGLPNPRHVFPAEDKEIVAYTSFSIYSLGYLAGCPDYTVPVGEVEMARSAATTSTSAKKMAGTRITDGKVERKEDVDGDGAGDGRGKEERAYLPVSVSLVAGRGEDGLLFEVLRELEGRGWLRDVRAGRRMYFD